MKKILITILLLSLLLLLGCISPNIEETKYKSIEDFVDKFCEQNPNISFENKLLSSNIIEFNKKMDSKDIKKGEAIDFNDGKIIISKIGFDDESYSLLVNPTYKNNHGKLKVSIKEGLFITEKDSNPNDILLNYYKTIGNGNLNREKSIEMIINGDGVTVREIAPNNLIDSTTIMEFSLANIFDVPLSFVDTDGDGIDDDIENLIGTDPNDPNDPPNYNDDEGDDDCCGDVSGDGDEGNPSIDITDNGDGTTTVTYIYVYYDSEGNIICVRIIEVTWHHDNGIIDVNIICPDCSLPTLTSLNAYRFGFFLKRDLFDYLYYRAF